MLEGVAPLRVGERVDVGLGLTKGVGRRHRGVTVAEP